MFSEKKRKRQEGETEENHQALIPHGSGGDHSSARDGSRDHLEGDEEEEALVALVEKRTEEVQRLQSLLADYKSQWEEAEMKLDKSKAKLSRFRASRIFYNISNSKPKLIIPAGDVKLKPSSTSFNISSNSNKRREKKAVKQEKRVKLNSDEKEGVNLISVIGSCSRARVISFETRDMILNAHNKRPRCLEISPTNDQLFATSAIDGVINLWQLQNSGSWTSMSATIDCVSPKQGRWPEDIAWHPKGDKIFSVYKADNDDSQISILDLSVPGQEKITFLEGRPHMNGVINNINFLPATNDSCFVTGGSDHAVILWQERESHSYNHETLHFNLHTSAVNGVCGLEHNKTVLSVGSDKRVIGFDLLAGKVIFKHQTVSKCMSVRPNPCDSNLYLVHLGSHGKQLWLYDLRQKDEVCIFGWKQETSESQSALISQSWSSDGWLLSSGSSDPKIHIFDIRYQGKDPALSVKVHKNRVFKAVWHKSGSLLTSISSDHSIGLHKVV